MVIRWANVARTKASSVSDAEEKARYERAGKRLNIMDSCIKIHRSWIHRGSDTAKAFADFSSAWSVLEAFAASEPKESICSPFMQNFFLEIKVVCSG